jgi:signal transduction histidine kinase
MESKRARIESLWTRRSGWLALCIVILVALVDYVLDRFLAYAGVSRGYLMGLGSLLIGMVAGGLFLYVARHEKAQRDQLREQMRTVADLNHHIRNALQVIKLCGAQSEASLDGRQLQLIKESADRIEWALREVLPRYRADEKTVMRQPPVGYAAAPKPVPEFGPFSERRHEARMH